MVFYALTYQKDHTIAQPSNVEFVFNGIINTAQYTALAQLLTPRVRSKPSDGKKS